MGIVVVVVVGIGIVVGIVVVAVVVRIVGIVVVVGNHKGIQIVGNEGQGSRNHFGILHDRFGFPWRWRWCWCFRWVEGSLLFGGVVVIQTMIR